MSGAVTRSPSPLGTSSFCVEDASGPCLLADLQRSVSGSLPFGGCRLQRGEDFPDRLVGDTVVGPIHL